MMVLTMVGNELPKRSVVKPLELVDLIHPTDPVVFLVRSSRQ